MGKRGGKKNYKKDTGIAPVKAPRENHIISATKTEIFSGPMPHPEILAQYDNIIPGSANRILCMVENQQTHRMGMEKKYLESDIAITKRGQVFGLAIALCLIIGGGVLIYSGKDIQGFTAILISGGVLITNYLTSSNAKKKNVSKKE